MNYPINKRTVSVVISSILYLSALLSPSAIIPNFEIGTPEVWYGYQIMYTGYLGLVSFQPAWFANPFYLLALYKLNSKISIRITCAAIILALCAPLIFVSDLLIGYYLWIISFVVLLYGNSRLSRYNIVKQ